MSLTIASLLEVFATLFTLKSFLSLGLIMAMSENVRMDCNILLAITNHFCVCKSRKYFYNLITELARDVNGMMIQLMIREELSRWASFFKLARANDTGAPNPTSFLLTRVDIIKHVVGSCLVGSPGGQGVRELSAVVKMYPVTRIRDISRTVLKNCRKVLPPPALRQNIKLCPADWLLFGLPAIRQYSNSLPTEVFLYLVNNRDFFP